MPNCAYCGSATELFDNRVAICISCSETLDANHQPAAPERSISAVLHQEAHDATVRALEASDAFKLVMGEIPSGMPRADGTRRILTASNELTAARKEMLTAQRRLNDFLVYGTIPENLKKSG